MIEISRGPPPAGLRPTQLGMLRAAVPKIARTNKATTVPAPTRTTLRSLRSGGVSMMPKR
jgi:hypothetical protein